MTIAAIVFKAPAGAPSRTKPRLPPRALTAEEWIDVAACYRKSARAGDLRLIELSRRDGACM